jgi:hypothetical protein
MAASHVGYVPTDGSAAAGSASSQLGPAGSLTSDGGSGLVSAQAGGATGMATQFSNPSDPAASMSVGTSAVGVGEAAVSGNPMAAVSTGVATETPASGAIGTAQMAGSAYANPEAFAAMSATSEGEGVAMEHAPPAAVDAAGDAQMGAYAANDPRGAAEGQLRSEVPDPSAGYSVTVGGGADSGGGTADPSSAPAGGPPRSVPTAEGEHGSPAPSGTIGGGVLKPTPKKP